MASSPDQPADDRQRAGGPLLVALAGQSRSGKGTCAKVFAEEAAKHGLTTLERQLSDNGKWSLARIFRPTIGRVKAVAWFETLKTYPRVYINIQEHDEHGPSGVYGVVTLQKFLQHGLQEGGRDIFGADLWIDRIIARGGFGIYDTGHNWLDTFFDDESRTEPTDLAIISDLRQPNEAQRVRDLDGVVVHLCRPAVTDQYRTGADHITERELDAEFERVIVNDGSLGDLVAQARQVFDELILPRLQGAS